ncbi:hypothetical protein D3C80_1553110 [compost metagenome]
MRQQRRAFQAIPPPGIFGVWRESADRVDAGVHYRMHGMFVDRQLARGIGKPRQRFFQQIWAVIRQAEIIKGEIIRADCRRQRPLAVHALLPQRTQLRWRKAFTACQRQAWQQVGKTDLLGRLHQRAGIDHQPQLDAIARSLRRIKYLP